MSAWIPVILPDLRVGDAVKLRGQDPSLDDWTLVGRVRLRQSDRLIVEWTSVHGAGYPPWPLWTGQVLAARHVRPGCLHRHRDHGPIPRTDEAGRAMMHALALEATRGDGRRLEACVRPDGRGQGMGHAAAEKVMSGIDVVPEWALRQLDGRMGEAGARAYDPRSRIWAARMETATVPVAAVAREAAPEVDEDVAAILKALPGARVIDMRRLQTAGDEVEVDDAA